MNTPENDISTSDAIDPQTMTRTIRLKLEASRALRRLNNSRSSSAIWTMLSWMVSVRAGVSPAKMISVARRESLARLAAIASDATASLRVTAALSPFSRFCCAGLSLVSFSIAANSLSILDRPATT